MKKQVLFYILLLAMLPTFCVAQLYIPSSIHAPLMDAESKLQIGAKINNYGLNYTLVGQRNYNVVTISFQHNKGGVDFNPLQFKENTRPTELIQSRPTKTSYGELGFGRKLNLYNQRLEFIVGLGQEFIQNDTRYFAQIDWGNDNRLIDAGISLRTSYTSIVDKSVFLLEPSIQAKIKLGKFRVVNQFSYTLVLNKGEDYIKPTFTLGVEYLY